MKKSTTDELVELAVSKPKQTKKTNKTEAIKKWLLKEVWNGRPINWLAICICYVCVAYTTYSLSLANVKVRELVGIIAFVSTLAICSRAFKK